MNPMLAASMIQGAATLGSGMMAASGQQQTNAANEAMLSQQENYETTMSDTAVQRNVADMKAAGLNPILAAGQGASTPSVGLPTMGSGLSAEAPSVQAAASSAASIVKVLSDAKASLSQADNSAAQAKLAESNANVADKNAGIKSIESSVMSDMNDVYNGIKNVMGAWLNRAGINTSSALESLSPSGMTNPVPAGVSQ